MFEDFDLPTFAIVAGAFAVGYWVVSAIIAKVKPPAEEQYTPEPQAEPAVFTSEPPLRARFDGSILETATADPESERHARALGLQGTVTVDRVKSAYRELLLQYHPDRTAHLGPEIQEVANRRTREITAAYEHFRRKLGF